MSVSEGAVLYYSVLDQSTVVTGRSPDQSIRESLALARHAEALGYHRYWVAEHHNSDSVAGSAPEVLIGAIAATTNRIRVGSAGVMLPHYAALHVAEQFRVLEAIAPGRIDLGLGRAPGSDRLTAHALNPHADPDQFPTQVRDVLAWLGDGALPEVHPLRKVAAQPAGPTVPETWILGSSDYGAQVAAHFGLPYCFAHFITDGVGAAEALTLYRNLFRPSERHPEPYAALCVWALAADTVAEAERQYGSRAIWRLSRDTGVFPALPSPEEAAAMVLTPEQQDRVELGRQRSLFGTGPDVARRLADLAAALAVQEVAVLTTTHDARARRRSYELLAESFGSVLTERAA